MSSIHEATPSQFAAFREHKARIARIKARAVIIEPVRQPEVIALPVIEPEVTPAHAFYVPWHDERTVTIRAIKAAVCQEFNVSLVEMMSKRRAADIVKARHVAMYLAKTLTLGSLQFIGRRFGGRDHSSIHHAAKKIGALMAADPAFTAKVNGIKNNLTEQT